MKYSSVLLICILTLAIMPSCGSGGKTKKGINSLTNKIGRKKLIEDYPKIPNEELLRDMPGSRVYIDLQQRYTNHLKALKESTDRDGAKLVIVIMTPEVGKFATPANTYGIPYIIQICTNLNIPFEDITPATALWSAVNDNGRAPFDGNWSRSGATFAANELAAIIEKYKGYRNKNAFAPKEMPATFGDATPENTGMDYSNEDRINGKKKPYLYSLNNQGLRMDHDLSFPKTKPRFLFMGDERILNPYIDDDRIITKRLQDRFPLLEIINAGNLLCSMDDYLSLYNEKTRFTNPDVVIVCTNGGDITDEFFTHRNKYSRTDQCYKPSSAEKEFYNKLTNKK